MKIFIHEDFTLAKLPSFVGYHLQIFTSGRVKISLQHTGTRKTDYFASAPKRDREGYLRQKARSQDLAQRHFEIVDNLLASFPDARVFRVHGKGDANDTADNAHVVASIREESVWVVMSTVVHKWRVPKDHICELLQGTGPRSGHPSVFNQYMSCIEHDWDDAEFDQSDYRTRPRSYYPTERQTSHRNRPTSVASPRAFRAPSLGLSIAEDDCVIDDLDEDPLMFTDPPASERFGKQDLGFPRDGDQLPVSVSDEVPSSQPTVSMGKSSLYGKEGLWAQLQ